MNNQLKKKNQNPQSKAPQYQTTQSPLPVLWIYVCFALNLWPLQLLGVAEYFYWFIHVFNRSFKTLHRSGHRLVKESRQRLSLVVLCSGFRCNFIIAAAGCCCCGSQALQSLCLGELAGCQGRQRRLCLAECQCGAGAKGRACAGLSNAAGSGRPGCSPVPFMIQGMGLLKWQLDSGFKVFSLRSDKSGGYLKQTLRKFKTDELWRGLVWFFFFDSRLLRWLWGWLNLKASLICVSTTY